MKEYKLKIYADRHQPKQEDGKHALMAFLSGGAVGAFGQILLTVYQTVFAMQQADAYAMMAVTVMAIASLLTAIGVYDRFAQKCGAGMFVPISGFANSLTSSALEGKSEGWVMGIGCNMFKLAGTVITYGVVAAVIFGSLRYLWMAGI
ncbi:SpoVA/SpoVAEb family sporulation membrane protein [Merdibacter massiliensis]|uniref:SpoVA/SpoVAEb family sporulation membrane protein n=1 Tax=Merdibacter massiliensis TaxID=1871030 RepID=UPI00096A7701|nr:SpoVA/SpoVAEb family sporulation membrane protein [Merdibacter massiliensis]